MSESMRKPLTAMHLQRQPAHITTTLYDVITAVSAQLSLNEQHLLTPAVMQLLKNSRADCLLKGTA